LPAVKAKPRRGECFDCFTARLLIAAYDHLKENLGFNHKHAAEAMGLCRASLYARIRRARERLDTCDACQPSRPAKKSKHTSRKT
jgi:hypothetical protein